MSPQRKARQCLTAAGVLLLCAIIAPLPPARAEMLATISGHLFVDWNHNLVRDDADFVIANAAVQISEQSDLSFVPEVVFSDASGLYEFDNLEPGAYTIRQITAANAEGRQLLGTLTGVDITTNVTTTLDPGFVPDPSALPSDFLRDTFVEVTIPPGFTDVVGIGYDVAATQYPLALVSKRFTIDWPPPRHVPEPATWALLIVGGLAVAGARTARRRGG